MVGTHTIDLVEWCYHCPVAVAYDMQCPPSTNTIGVDRVLIKTHRRIANRS